MIELRRRYSGSKGSDSPSFSRLPKGYQEVEYLESTGTQYIDTEYYPQVDDKIYIDTIIERIGVSWQGCRKYLDYAYFIGNNSVRNIFTMAFGDKTFGDTEFDNFNKRALFSIDRLGGYVSLNGNEEKIANWDIAENITKESGLSFILFGRYDTYGNLGLTLTHNINYLFKVERDGKVYREFIPCYRTSDYKPGMYDIVNDVFYPNAGTGEFSYGPDVHYNIPFEYQQVEYLESTGTQYMIVNFDSQYHSSGIYNAIGEHMTFGAYNNYGSQSLQLYDYGNDSAVIRIGTAVSDTISPSPKYIQMDTGTGKVMYDDNVIQIDGALSSDFYFLHGIPLFGRFNTSSINPRPSVFKRFYVSYKNSIVLDLIPCYRKEDNVVGMYDLVSGEFYTNAGTGEFIVGLDVIG